MPAQYISFVIRLLVSDDEQSMRGRLFCVPDQDGQYFGDWDSLLALIQAQLRRSIDQSAHPTPGAS